MDAEDKILMMGYLLMRKRRNHRMIQQKCFFDHCFCCSKTVIKEKFLLYHSLSPWSSLSFVVSRFTTLCHSLTLVITRCTTRLSKYKRSFLLFYLAQKFNKFCWFIHFRWVDVKSSRCFGGLSLISIIL